MKKRLLILNQKDTNNYGDDAISLCVAAFFKEKGCEVYNFTFWSDEEVFGKNPYTCKFLKHFLWDKPQLMNFLNRHRIKKLTHNLDFDAIIIGGGELLGRHYGFVSSFSVWTDFANRRGIPIYIIGVSGSADLPKYYLSQNKQSLKKAEKLFVRDHTTKEIIKKKYGVEAKVFPDVVFSYSSLFKENRKTHAERDTLLVVPIDFTSIQNSLLKLHSRAEYLDYLDDTITHHASDNIRHIIVSPSTREDEGICRELWNLLTKRHENFNIQLQQYSNLEDFLKIIKTTKKIISCRMHPMILGLASSCTVVPIPFKNKLVSFSNEYVTQNRNMEDIKKQALESMEKIYQEIAKA